MDIRIANTEMAKETPREGKSWHRGEGTGDKGVVGWLPLKDFIPSLPRPWHPYIRVSNLRATPLLSYFPSFFFSLSSFPYATRSSWCVRSRTPSVPRALTAKQPVSCMYELERGPLVNSEKLCIDFIFIPLRCIAYLCEHTS